MKTTSSLSLAQISLVVFHFLMIIALPGFAAFNSAELVGDTQPRSQGLSSRLSLSLASLAALALGEGTKKDHGNEVGRNAQRYCNGNISQISCSEKKLESSELFINCIVP